MNQIFPVLCQPAHCVNPTELVGFTQLFFTRPGYGSCEKPAGLGGFTQLFFARPGCGSCVKPVGLVGFTQLLHAGLMLTKRIFTQLGLIGGVDDKQPLAVILKNSSMKDKIQ